MAHANARLTVYTRVHIVGLRRQGYAPAWIAEVTGVSRATVYKWLTRFENEGEAGLADRSSRPHLSHTKLTPKQIAAVCRLRRKRAWGPHRIGWKLGVARSTVYAVLRRLELNRLDHLHRSTRETIRIVQRAPGELVHLDVKKFGRVPPGGGKRMAPGFHETGAGGVRLKRTRPYRPQTNGKAEAFIRTLQREWAYITLYRTNQARLRALPRFLAEYNGHRPHTGLGGLSPTIVLCQQR